MQLSCLAGFGSSGSWTSCSGPGLEDLGIGSVALGGVWELGELDLSCLSKFGSPRRSGILTASCEPKRPGGSPKAFTRGISTVGELWELWEISGRGVGTPGAGFVVLGEVWEIWELDLLCLARFGSSRAAQILSVLSGVKGPGWVP